MREIETEMREITIIKPDVVEIATERNSIVARAGEIEVRNAEEFQGAGVVVMTLAGLRKRIVAAFRPSKQAADTAHSAICKLEADFLVPVEAAERAVKSKMGVYQVEQERIAREERMRLEAEARKKEEDRRLREAEALEKQGRKAEAEAVISEPVNVPPPAPKHEIPKVEGMSFREVWKAEVVSLSELVKYACTNQQFINMVEPNQTAINAMARSLRGEMRVPGVRVWAEKQMAARVNGNGL